MYQSDSAFEDEVRRIARLLWPAAEFDGAAMVEGRERDGIFVGEEFVQCIECTIARGKRKAEEDCKKLQKLIRRLRSQYPLKLIRGWFITRDEPTADQRTVTERYRPEIVCCGFDQFRSKIIDAKSYLDSRARYPFGSVRDPESGATDFDLQFVEIEILSESGDRFTAATLSSSLQSGRRIVLTGDFGAGKSSTAREVFFHASRDFRNGRSSVFPVLLNLRDHHGQSSPVEALERHARNVGFGIPAALVRAWRAGFCFVMLDGFDEIASAGWAGTTKPLRDLRYRSMELVRHFFRETPRTCGLLVSGRDYFFDSEKELRQALGTPEVFVRLRLSEMSAEQVKHFVARLGWRGVVPEWLPTRPLLLGYLAAKGLITATGAEDVPTPAAGWDQLLDRIAKREAEIEAGLDPRTIRRLIERIATIARSSIDGLGPVSSGKITSAFKQICGYAPDDRGMVLLQRLPGLGGVSAEDGSRAFIDADFAEAARVGDVFAFIEDPYNPSVQSEGWHSMLRPLGIEIAGIRCRNAGVQPGKVWAAFDAAIDKHGEHTLGADVLFTFFELGGELTNQTYVKGIPCEELALLNYGNLSLLEFQDSVFGTVELSEDFNSEAIPTFRRCVFGRIEGLPEQSFVNRARFIDCTVGEFEPAARTTSALLKLPLPMATRVLLTLLQKLFAQSGRGRRESALFRGLDHKAQSLVPALLDLMRRSEFVIRTRQGTNTVWLPSRAPGVRSRALEILAEHATSSDPLVEATRTEF